MGFNTADFVCVNRDCAFYEKVRTASLPIVGHGMFVWTQVNCECGFAMRSAE